MGNIKENKKRNPAGSTMWNRAFIIILTVNFCHQMGQQMMNTLVPKYANALGSSAYLVGLLGTAFAVFSLLIRPFAGPAFDSFSKKKLLIAALCGIFVVFVGYGISENVYTLLGARLLHGACVGCVAPLSLAIAGDSLPDACMGSGIGIFSLCQAVGQAVGPNLGLNLSQQIGYPRTFFIGAAVMLLSILFSLFIQEKKVEREPYQISIGKIIEKDSLHPAVLMFCLMIAYTCIGSYLAIYGELRGVEKIGLYFTVYAVCLLLTRPVSGRLIDRYGYGKVLIPGMICFALSFLIIGSSRSLSGFLLAAVVNAFGYGVCYPAMQSLSMNCADKSRRGAAASTSYLGADFSMLTGPFLAGLFVDKVAASAGSEVTGYSMMFYVMMAPILIGLVYYIFVRKKIEANIERNSVK